jgi:hypothetical protein
MDPLAANGPIQAPCQGETLPLLQTSFNRSPRIGTRPERLTTRAVRLLLREAIARSGIVRWAIPEMMESSVPELPYRQKSGATYRRPSGRRLLQMWIGCP